MKAATYISLTVSFRTLLSGSLLLLICSVLTAQSTISVNNTDQLRSALEQVDKGTTIIVEAGIYEGHEYIIRNSVHLKSEGEVVMDAMGKGDIFIIAGDSITIEGFTLRNTGHSNLNDHSGVKVFDSRFLWVKNNRFVNTFFGIHISNSHHLFILNNHFESHEKIPHRTGNGIHLWKSDTALISGNYIFGHRDGIYLEFVTVAESSHNVVEYNNRYGLHFMFSHDNSYYHNTFRHNDAGVAVMYTRNVDMRFNIFENNLGSGSYGVLLKDISNSTMKYNRIVNNTIGIYMDGSNNNIIEKNLFRRNGWAIRLLASCDGNLIAENNFVANTFDISTNGRLFTNRLKKNYWDRYNGYDLDRNGYGDVPHRPINLYSTVVERIPSAIILWRSFMVTMLDQAERVIPVITPENLQDEEPKMRPHDINFKTE